MAGNVLWTTIFNKQGSQSAELTRQRIVQEERCGRRPSSIIPGPQYDELVRGRGAVIPDPWSQKGARHSLGAPTVGYSGTVPRVRPEHTGITMSEQQDKFKQQFGTLGYRSAQNMAPGGGASALGTKPMPIPGSKTPIGMGIYDKLLMVRKADPLASKHELNDH